MYSPPAATSGPTKQERPSSSASHPSGSFHQPQHIKLPSLPPFPSLVSSLGEPLQEYSLNSSKSSSQAASPASHHPQLSTHTSNYPHSYQSSFQEGDSAARLNWPQESSHDPVRSRTATSTTSISSGAPASAEETKRSELPLPAGYSDPFRRAHSHLASGGIMSGLNTGPGQVDRESSIRTGSSASTSEPPLSPGQGGAAKRRRLSVAHETYPHGIPAGDMHDQGQLVDELSPMLHGNESASPTGDAGDDQKGANGRTLKQTKRAAQNRAAQQAFRKRKEERIKELEDKEKVLNALVARENEIIRKEKVLAEREQALARNGASIHGHEGRPEATVSASTPATNDWDRAFANAPVASPLQHIAERLEASNRTVEALRTENEQLKDRLTDKTNLIESLRRSLEDLGAENRSLRDAVGRQTNEPQAQQSRAS